MSSSPRNRRASFLQHPRRWSLTFAFVLTALVGISVACGDSKNGVSGSDRLNPQQPMCGTPQMGCPCDAPGAKVICGKKISGANNFLYCFEGVRTCLPTGLYGDCEEGSIHSKNLSTIHITALATTAGACQGISTAPLLVCTNGRRTGEPCTVNADCAPGIRRCFGSTDSTQNCRDDSDCNVSCERFNGQCSGGGTPGIGCMVDADCSGGTCPASGGGNNCGTYTGICDSPGPEDGNTCNADADCPGGNCRNGHGVCIGGRRNGKHCHRGRHCRGGGYCTSDIQPDAATTQLIDPCDPYCQVYSDSPDGFDAGPGFLNDGAGITPIPGCGNGALNGGEQCDDGNVVSGDGCTASCMLEVGYQCPTPGSPCIPSTCGNGIVEGLEQCDDGNFRPYDGCSPTCTREVTCPATGPCTAVCGDGIKFPSEACDDGNLTDGDGCSSTCTVETGATCNTVIATAPPFIDVPVIYRDFDGNTHPDFQKFNGGTILPHNVPPAAPWYYSGTINCPGGTVTGIPSINLAADKQPVLNATQSCTASAAHFFQWYHDDATVNSVILGKSLRLFDIGGGAYRFNSQTDTVTTNNINCGDGTGTHCQSQGGFWPIDGLGFGDWAATGKNFHFTSEVRVPFTYAGGENLDFTGDDDVFVYVNGMKVVDLGGVHGPANGNVTLNAGLMTTPAPGVAVGLVAGQTYEIVVYQAERNTTGSNYRLTLQGFNRTTSVCSVPAPPVTIQRDFQAQCPPGNKIVWSLFRWQAGVPVGAGIDFRAATNDDPTLLPTLPSDPTAVAIGSATNANSPPPPAVPVWAYDTTGVDARLQAGGQSSKQWLRVFMTFNGLPILYQWQQLFDCIPAE